METCSIWGRFPLTRLEFRQRPSISVSPKISTPEFKFCARSGLSISNSGHENRMLVLGMGYVGQFFAQQLKNEGWVVSGTCTSTEKKKELEQKGFDVHLFNAFEPDWRIVDSWKSFTHLLVSVPPARDIGDPVLQHEHILRTALVDGNLQWLCYLSSTSVYGDCGGAWVDEDYVTKPNTKAARARLKAEEGWLKLANDLNVAAHVLRLGGIYGPGRSAIDTMLKQEPLSGSQKRRMLRRYTSRVHVADICQVLKATISIPVSRKIYNVADDDPASRADVFAFAEQLIEQKWPGMINSTDFSTTSNADEKVVLGEKRVLNARVKKELGVKLLHPSYRSGLQDVIKHMQSPGNHTVGASDSKEATGYVHKGAYQPPFSFGN